MHELYRWRWSRGSRILVVRSRDEAVEACHLSRPALVVCDIEPFLVDWTAQPRELAPNAADLARRLRPINLVLCTNSGRFTREPRMPRLIAHARKPFTDIRHLRQLNSCTIVIGDLLILDGLLALRLRSDFIWFRQHASEAPPWPRCLARVDQILRPLLIKRLEL